MRGPTATNGDLYQYESAGLYNQNQIITNFNVHASKVSLFGFYTLSYADSNTAGAASFPMNHYDLAEDYGRAAYDIRHRLFLGGSWNFRKGFQVFPFVVANSAPPFNITLGEDSMAEYPFSMTGLHLPQASPTRPMSSVTRWGTFDTVPVAGETIIPPNYGTGFSQFAANLRLSKTFAFGKEVREATRAGAADRAWPGTWPRRAEQHGDRRQYVEPRRHHQPPLQSHLERFSAESVQQRQ